MVCLDEVVALDEEVQVKALSLYDCRDRVCRIGRYADFSGLLASEDPATIAPDLTRDALLVALRLIYPPDKEALGVVALEIEPLL